MGSDLGSSSSLSFCIACSITALGSGPSEGSETRTTTRHETRPNTRDRASHKSRLHRHFSPRLPSLSQCPRDKTSIHSLNMIAGAERSTAPTASGETTPLFGASGPKDPSSPELDHALHRLNRAANGSSSGVRRAGPQDEDEEALLGEGEEEEVIVEGEDQATTFVWVLVGAAAISGLLFGESRGQVREGMKLMPGYDTGVISGELRQGARRPVLRCRDVGSHRHRPGHRPRGLAEGAHLFFFASVSTSTVPLLRPQTAHDSHARIWSAQVDAKEMITSATTLGALFGGLAAGTLSDYTGRKPVIAMSNAVFILGALLQAVSSRGHVEPFS